MENSKITIAVLLGGTSPERAVSKQSGKSIYFAVKALGYNVKIIDPAYGLNQPEKIEDYFSDCDCGSLSNENYIKVINSSIFSDVDLVIIALHGKWGEDGTIQSLLELKGIKYTGSGVLGSSLSMDKARSKVMFTHFGVSTPKWIEATVESELIFIKNEIENKFNYPIIVKPNDQGSTIGLTKCSSDSDLGEALKLALQFSKVALIEEFIVGREIAVGIINGQVLPLLEIIPKHEIYDYECKYTDGMSEYIVPAKIDSNIEEELKRQAKIAFESLGCEDYGRVDFRLTADGKPYCFEINTLPGMTSHSLVPKMAKAMDINFEQLVDMIIKSAL
ncbi:MAG: D-alanine--D-alanine ligase [Melioribacteraceae bacterium]|nr:D-alanine--D-alanine ligase [Melioribacteraceae bacterium]